MSWMSFSMSIAPAFSGVTCPMIFLGGMSCPRLPQVGQGRHLGQGATSVLREGVRQTAGRKKQHRAWLVSIVRVSRGRSWRGPWHRRAQKDQRDQASHLGGHHGFASGRGGHGGVGDRRQGGTRSLSTGDGGGVAAQGLRITIAKPASLGYFGFCVRCSVFQLPLRRLGMIVRAGNSLLPRDGNGMTLDFCACHQTNARSGGDGMEHFFESLLPDPRRGPS